MPYERLSLILPAYRQAGTVEAIVGGHEEALASLPLEHETLVVVNGPRDGTLEAARRLEGRFPAVRVVESDPGWGRAVRRGLGGAGGDLICFTNSARTAPDDLIRVLREAVGNPGTVVKAKRGVRDNWKRRWGSLLYNLECRLLFRLTNSDVNGTPKAFPRTFDGLLGLSRDDDLIDLEFSVVCRERGYPLVEIPVESTRRHGGESTTTYGSAIRMYRGAAALWRQRRRPTG